MSSNRPDTYQSSWHITTCIKGTDSKHHGCINMSPEMRSGEKLIGRLK